MALISVEYKQHPTLPHLYWVKVVDDAGTHEQQVLVPELLPEGVTSIGDYAQQTVRAYVRFIRNQAHAAAHDDAWNNTDWDQITAEDASGILAALQSEFDG